MGTGWLVALTVVWLLAAMGTGLWYLAAMNDPAGRSLPDGALRYLAGGGAVLLIYAVPVGLGLVAYQRGAGAWVWLLYLLPHVSTGLFAAAVSYPSWSRRRVR